MRRAASGKLPWTGSRVGPSTAGWLSIVAGTAGGQVLTTACAPVLSRMYDPADFGVFTIVSAAAAILGTVAALRFELAIPIPAREREVHSLLALGLFATILTTAVSLLLTAVWGGDLAGALAMPALTPWLWVIPLVAAVIGASALLNQVAIRAHRFSAVGRRSFLQYAVMTVTQVGGGFLGAGPGGLIVGLGAGQTAAGASLLKGSGLSLRAARSGARRQHLRSALRAYARFPLLLAPAGLINVVGTQAPVMLFAFYYGAEVAGWFAFTQRILALPVALLGVAVAQVYLAEAAEAARSGAGTCRRLHVRASRKLAACGAAAAAVLIAFGPWLFTTVFCEVWATSGTYGRALAISLAMQFVAAPLSQTLVIFGREVTQFLWDCGRLLLVMGSVPAAVYLDAGPTTAVWAMGTASALCYGVLWLLSFRATASPTGRGQAPIPVAATKD